MHHLAGARMLELQHVGMQRLAVERLDDPAGLIRQKIGLGPEAGAVDGIAQQRMADVCHVDADLVRAAGFQVAFDEGGKRARIRAFMEALEHFVMGDRLVGALVFGALDGAAGAIAGGTAERASIVPESERGRPQTIA